MYSYPASLQNYATILALTIKTDSTMAKRRETKVMQMCALCDTNMKNGMHQRGQCKYLIC